MPLRGKEAYKRRIRERSDKLVRAVGLEAHRRLIRRTPVDTGRAKGNWNVGVGEPDRSEDPESKDRSGGQALQRGASRILAQFRAGDRLFLTNAVPYVPELEKGSSKQAPNGMIAVTVAEMRPLVSRVAAKIAVGGGDAV